MKSLILLFSAICLVSGAFESEIDYSKIPEEKFSQIPQNFTNFSKTTTLFTPVLGQTLQFPSFNTFATFLQQLFSFSNNPVSAFRQINSSSDLSFPQSFIATLQNAFETFQKSINETLSRGIGNILNSVDRLNSTAQLTFSKIQNLTTQSIANFDEKINEYNGTIQKCIEDNVSGYNQIIPTAANKTIDCINNKVQNGVEIIEEGRNDIANAVKGASDLSSAIQKCSSDYQFGCYISALVNIRSDTVFLPIQLSKRFTEMETYIGKTSADVVRCGIIFVETIAAQSINVTQTITNCIFQND